MAKQEKYFMKPSRSNDNDDKSEIQSEVTEIKLNKHG